MKRQIVIHPLLFAAYPILSLLAYNITEVQLKAGIRPLLASLAVAAIVMLLLALLFKDWHKAGLLTSLFTLWFFSYAHVYRLLKTSPIPLLAAIGRHRYVALASLLLIALVVWWILRNRRNLARWSSALNFAGACALLFPILSILSFSLHAAGSLAPTTSIADQLSIPNQPPDIYYIILDSYAREDILQDVFEYDNQPFLKELQERGFFIASRSHSNYGRTALSLASSLNMDFLQNLIQDLDPESSQQQILAELIKQSRVRITFEDLGYTIVAFSTGYKPTEIKDADIYITGGTLDQIIGLNAFSDFEGMLIDNSAGLILMDGAIALPLIFPDLQYPYQLHREWVLNIFEHLTEMPSRPGPKFVFAHIIAPHSPFVFQRDGTPVERATGFTLGFTFGGGESLTGEAYIRAYRDQLHYINTKLLEMVDAILEGSDTPPVIVLQSDHGPIPEGSTHSYIEQRMTIFNAYYLPSSGNQMLYPQITPVNTFRIIFNTYFEGELELLEERVYFSVYPKIYQFDDVTGRVE
jgi:hypothetical protein